jgi:NADH-quinone oxidoreductase subunit L
MINLLAYRNASLINQVFLKFMLHFINLGLILAGGVIVRQLTRDPGILSINLITWFHLDLIYLAWDLQIDSLSAIMLLITSLLSSMINFYALDYMYADAHYDQFMALLSLFGLAINCLALTNNLGYLYFTWELVGICSYLLVVYWKERQHSLKSGFKPILYNKLGDIAYLYSASLVFDLVKTIDLELVNLLTPWFRY